MNRANLFEEATQTWVSSIPPGIAEEFRLDYHTHAHLYIMFLSGFQTALQAVRNYRQERGMLMGASLTDPLLLDMLAEIDSLDALASVEQVYVEVAASTQPQVSQPAPPPEPPEPSQA